MDAAQFTEAQILCGLRLAWRDSLGHDEPFDAQTRIFCYLKSHDDLDELDFAEPLERMEKVFGFHCSMEEWKKFFEFDSAKANWELWDLCHSPRLTFGSLAKFIADRAPIVSLHPIPVGGKVCAPAGAYLGIEQLAHRLSSHLREFGPSTPIRDVLDRRGVTELWKQLSWITHFNLPGLRCSGDWLLAVGLLGVMVGLGASIQISSIVPVSGAALVMALLWRLSDAIDERFNWLPPNIKTFRDLAVFISKIDCDATRGTC